MKKKNEQQRIYPELNLEKWSIWQPANSRNQVTEMMIRREFNTPDGGRVCAEVEVSANSKYGPLNTEDQKVYYALLKLWQDQGRSDQRTPSGAQPLARILKRKWGKNAAQSLMKSLYRLRFTAFIWRNSYYDSNKKQVLEIVETFNILSELRVARRRADGTLDKEVGYFRFNDLIISNLLNGYTKPLLLEQIVNFKSEIAQMLYHYLDLVMADKSSYQCRTVKLFEQLQLKGEAYKNPSDRKRKLDRAIPELQGAQLTSGRIAAISLIKTSDAKDYKLIVQKGALLPPPQESLPIEPIAKDPMSEQAEQLVKHFYQLFHPDVKEVKPSRKEISQAHNFITKYGWEKGSYIVDFSRSAATKTNYQPQIFGGILAYEAKAIAEYERQQQQQNHQQAHIQAQQRDDEEMLAGLSTRLETIPKEQYHTIYEKVKSELLSELPWLETKQEGIVFKLAMSRAMVWELDHPSTEPKN